MTSGYEGRSRQGSRLARLVLGAGVSILVACQSAAPPNPLAARSRLEALLEVWEEARREDGGCEQRRPTDTPLVDCDVITREIERLAIEFPRQPDVLLAASVVALERGRREDAAKTLDILRSVQPIHPDAAVLRARLAIREGNLRFARRLLDEQRSLTPDHSGLWELAASVAYLRGDYAAAMRDLDIAARLGAPGWRAAYHRGLVAEASGRLDLAAAEFAACLEAAPDFRSARSRLRALAVRGADSGWVAGSPR